MAKVLGYMQTTEEDIELKEWLESLDDVVTVKGPERAQYLLEQLKSYAEKQGLKVPFSANTPYINTIPVHAEPSFPGDRKLERRIKSIIRWNAMAMVIRANRAEAGIGGHISTYASAATLYEIGFNHFFHAPGPDHEGDIIYFQGHSTPGIYARAFLEGRITEKQLENFRREFGKGGGLASYPHPWLMPNFWQFPTVSMGLGSIMAIYQARFNQYLEDRGLKKPGKGKVWAFLGDGEMDEPESLGAITLATREKLDNLIFVINCNLQRLDGPVRGNGKIIQELETVFRGAGWNVIKVIWGSDWDPLLENDSDGLLVKGMSEAVDGQYQKYSVSSGQYIRKHFFGTHPQLNKLVQHLSDEELQKLKRGGHDPVKVYAAYKAAVEHTGSPTVILAKTIKGYGLGESGEGKNITHQQKKLNEEELKAFRERFDIPISEKDIASAPFFRPKENSPEIQYLKERRKRLGGYIPQRSVKVPSLSAPPRDIFQDFYEGTKGRPASTTMAFVRMLAGLLKDQNLGKLIVPIVPDEARTFGMEALFRQCGIYSHVGQLYEPVDRASLLYYKEAKDGQILEEGITEAGSISSFIAAGTAYATYGINTIPFFIFYSMFGFQRIGDLIWAAADQRSRGFLVGGTAGRTTLAGEGLQHQDGQSHLLAYPVPNLITYDPAFAYEIAVIVREGIRRMYENGESIFYYFTVENENYEQPQMPKGVEKGILRGMYKYKTSNLTKTKTKAHLFGSGAILNEALKAQQILEHEFKVSTDVWSITSYKELYRNGLETERWNILHPTKDPRKSYIETCLEKENGVCVAASDYVKALPLSISRWFPDPLIALGTDGFGRSEGRAELRDFFEVDAKHIALAALYGLFQEGKIQDRVLKKALSTLKIDSKKLNPMVS